MNDGTAHSSNRVMEFHVIRISLIAAFAAGLASVVAFGGLARADFTIIPTTVTLTAQKTTELVTIHNTGARQTRLQATAYDWAQKPDGRFILTPTDDVVLYPPLITVEPGQDRIVRIGAGVPIGAAERVFRLVIEELPAPPEPRTQGQTGVQSKVLVLTRMSMPVFLLPPAIETGSDLGAAAIQNGRLTFRIKNDGNTHLVAPEAKIEGFGPGDKTVFKTTATQGNGYVLAGRYTDYAVEISGAQCRHLSKIAIEASVLEPTGEYDVKHETLKTEVQVTPDRCGSTVAAGAR